MLHTIIIASICIAVAAYILGLLWHSITPRDVPTDAPTDENDEQSKTRKKTIIKKMYD